MSLQADLSCLQAGGPEEREAAMTALEKQLMCPICLELFNKPVVILPCQHNLCRKCANELYQARTTMMVNSGRFRCPSCRHEVVLDRHGVYGLQRNLLVENIIDVYKQEVSHLSPAPLPPPPPSSQPTCSDHDGEKMNIYCLTCRVPTCSRLQSVRGPSVLDELSGGVRSLVAFRDKIQSVIDELEETCRHVEENCKAQKQSVSDKFNRMFSILDERHKAMTQQITAEQEEKTGHAQALASCYGDSVEANTKLLETAASSMEEPDMAAFIQVSVIGHPGRTEKSDLSFLQNRFTLRPGYENLRSYRFNFGRQERALRSIDFSRGDNSSSYLEETQSGHNYKEKASSWPPGAQSETTCQQQEHDLLGGVLDFSSKNSLMVSEEERLL
uniref:Tripartite motif containing 101 n=1 Tax=Echeneis naucrates TaxID=173247 RepID=A0A665VCW7_ECHNA